MEQKVILVICAVLASTLAVPVQFPSNQDSCSTTCTGSNKFQFKTGRTYQYKYESDMKTLVKGASEDHAALHVTADIDLEILSKCELNMKLRNVRLDEYDPAESVMRDTQTDFTNYLQRYPVRLSYQDGTITDVCLTADEPTWVLNVKRGIISLLQNNIEDLNTKSNSTVSETDVNGVCDTEYYVKNDGWYTKTIGKSKNLLGCTERGGHKFNIQSVPYLAESSIQSLPVLKSDHSCEHTVDKDSGLLQSALCTEQHTFRPFSNSDNGATTINKQSLHYISITSGTRSPSPITSRVSLKFDHADITSSDSQNRNDIINKLQQICEVTVGGVTSDTPKLFADLVYLMKVADTATLKAVYQVVSGDSFCPDNSYRTKQFFLDALPMTGTTGAVVTMAELIQGDLVKDKEADMWLTTIPFVKTPTSEMLVALKPLMEVPNKQQKAMLTLGSLVHSYCRNRDNCEREAPVRDIVQVFSSKIVPGCKVNIATMKPTLLALRGIGNAGYATSAIPELESCVLAATNPMEVRMSAIQAFRRMPCGSSRSALVRVLEDVEEDSELRIGAYKMLMECPSPSLLNTVRAVLDSEQVNQVGSYIWTHLTNLMETSDRHKQDIRALLNDVKLQKEFDLDKRKFSRNYEGSLFLDAFNMGAKAEGDLIWSQKSFLPRAAALNLTVDLFGHSINLFEMGGRVEGMDYFLEQFFGPDGIFSKYAPSQDEPTKDVDVPNVKMDKLSKINKRMSGTKSELSGSLYMRVFGNELSYMNFHSLDDLMSSQFNALEMLINLAEKNEYTYTHSSLFLDGSYIIPMSSGFPLNLTVNGTATVDLRMKGKMDLRSMPTVNIDGLIQPSAAIDISSVMSVDAYVTKSGVKMQSTLHTSMSVQGRVSVDKAGSILAELDTPQDKMNVIDVKTSFFTLHRDMERPQRMIEENRQTKTLCSSTKLVTILGVQLCSELSYPNASLKSDSPFFPLTGPVNGGIYLYKRDRHTKYHFSLKSIHNAYKNRVLFMFDTPESLVYRQLKVDINLSKNDNDLVVDVATPWQNAYVHGKVTNTKKLKSFYGDINIQGYQPYVINAMVPVVVVGNKYEYKPSLEILSNKKQLYMIDGLVSHKGVRQFQMEVGAKGFTKSPMSAQVTINNNPKLIGLKGSVELEKGKTYSIDSNVKVKGYAKKATYTPFLSVRTPTEEKLSFGGSVVITYGNKVAVKLVLDKAVDKAVLLNAFVQRLDRKRGRVLYKTKVKFQSSPADLALNLKLDNHNYKIMSTDLEMAYVIRKVARNSIKFLSKFIDQSSRTRTRGRTSMNLEVKRNPELNMKMLASVEHNAKLSQMDVDVMYGADFKDTDKKIDFSLTSNHVLPDMDITSRLRFPALGIATRVDGNHHFDNNNMTSRWSVEYSKGKSMNTAIELLNESTDKMKISTNFDFSYPDRTISLRHDFAEIAHEKYVSTLTTGLQKGKMNKVETSFERASDKLIVASEISLSDQQPFRVQGQYGYTDRDITARLDYTTDIKTRKPQQYAVYLEGKIDDIALVNIGAEKPDFGVDLTMKAQLQGVFSIESDLELRNDSQSDKYTAKLWFLPTESNLNGSLTLMYPSRTIIVSANHQIGSKQKTGVNVQWGPEQFIDVDTSFQLDDEDLFGTATMRTSLLSKPVKVTVNHGSDKSEYTTKLDFDWGEILSINSVVKKPITIQTLVATIDASSSIKDIRKMSLFINHKMKKSVVSNAKFAWNKQFYEIDVTAENTSKAGEFGFTGQVDLKTSNSYMKKGTFSISHDNNGNIFNTNIKAIRNRREYLIDSKITHSPLKYRYMNKGEITITMPSTNINTKWDHEHTADRFSSNIEGQWDKEYSMVQVSGDFKDGISTACQVRIPVGRGEAVFEQRLLIKEPNIDGQINLKMNGNNMANFEVKFGRKENFTTGYLLEVPDLGVDSKVQFTTFAGRCHFIANLMAVFTPDATFNLDLKQELLNDEHISISTIDWTSTIPGHEKFKYTYEVLDSNNNELKTMTTVEYKEGKKIKLQTVLLIDLHKQYEYRALLTTPFESLPSIQGGINFDGDREKFTSTIYLEISKYLEKISAEVKWDTVDQLYCGVELLLVDDMQLTGEVKLINEKTGSASVAFRNQRSQLYSVSTEYNLYDKSEGIVTITIPGQRDIILKLTHDMETTGFTTRFEVQHNRNNNLLSVVKYSAEQSLLFSSTFNLKTTVVPELDNTEMSAVFVGSWTMVNIDGHFTTPRTGRYGGSFSFDLNNDIQATFSTTTPSIYNIMAKFRYTDEPSFLQSNTELEMDGSSLLDVYIRKSLDLSSFTGIMKVKSAVTEDFELSTIVNNYFDSISTVSYGQNKAELSMKSTRSTSLIKRTIQFSATGLPNVDIEVEHDDDYSNLQSGLQVNNGTHLHKVDASFDMDNIKNSLTTRLNIQTPLMRLIDFTFNVDGLATNFKAHTELTLGTEKSEANMDFAISPNLKARLTINSHYSPIHSVSLSHTGSFPNTETYFIFSLPIQKTYAFSMKMGSKEEQFFSLLVDTPLMALTSFSTKMQFQQQTDLVTSSASFKVVTDGKKISNLDLSLHLDGNSLSTQVNMGCPGIPNVNAKFTHEGNINDFRCHAEYSLDYGKDRGMANFSFSNAANLQSALKVVSPQFEPIVITLKHTGTHASQFSTIVDTSIQGYSRHMNVDIDLVNKAKVNAELDLPELYILASVNETIAGYEGELKYMGNDDTYSLQADYTLTNKMTVKGKLETPVLGFTTDFDGTFTKFEASAVLSLEDGVSHNTFRLDADDLSDMSIKYLLTKANGEIIDVDISEAYSKRLVKFNGSIKRDGSKLYGVDVSLLNKASPIANVEIVAPMKYSPAILSAVWNPRETGFTCTGNLNLNRDKSTMELNFDNSQKTESTFSISSPFIPPINGKFILTENYNLESDLYIDSKLEQSLKMVVGDSDWQFSTLPSKMTVSLVQGEAMKMDLDYDLNERVINFDLSSTTPHTLRVIYNLQASLPEFNWNSELTHLTDKWQLATSLSTKNNIQGDFKIEMPNRDPIIASLTHTEKNYRCSTQAVFSWNDTTKLEGDLSLNWRNGLDSTFSVSTPFKGYEVSEIKVSHERSVPFVKSLASIRFAGEKGSVSVDLSKENGEITLKTPFEYVEDIAVTYYVKGDVYDLKTGGNVRYAVGKEAKLDISHSYIGMTCATSASLQSPFADVTISAEHVGTWTDFTNTWEVSLDEDNKITSKTGFKLGLNSLTFSNTLTTVATGETFEQAIELTHDGSPSQFQSGLMLKSLGQKIALDASFQMQPVLEGKFSLMTPMENMKDMGVSFSHRADSSQLLSTAEVKYATGKLITGKINLNNNGWRRLNADLELSTPFENFETNRIVYTHIGGSGRMQCDAEVSIMRETMKGTMAASITPLSFNLNIDTPFEQYEKLALKGNLVADSEGHYSAFVQTGWNRQSEITMDTSLTLFPLDVSIVMTTPFQQLRQGSVEVYHKNKFAMYTAGIKVVRNSDSLFDMTADYDIKGARKNLVLTFQAPRKMLYSINGDVTTKLVNIDMNFNWNQDSLYDNLRIEGGYDVRSVEKTMKASMSYGKVFLSADVLCDDVMKKMELAWGRAANEKVACEYQYSDKNFKGKLILPARSLELSLTRLRQQTKGEFLWDADNDATKKIGFQSVVVTDNDAVTADITITMPKDVQLGSTLTINSGRVLFEGRTQLSYSTDSSKNLVFFTKLEDLTQAETANYSLSVGVSQPCTTIDVQMNSHVSSSKSGYSANIGLDYLTATRQVQTFKAGANINKIKKTVDFELQSPVKTISIYGNIQTDRQFTVTLRNVYDERQPLNTVLHVDPARRMIDFYMNYDIDYPSKKIHFTAGYVNSTAVRAEVSHSINGAQTTDAILTARLNNSHLLHSRLHWRPQAIPEIKAYWSEVIESYSSRADTASMEMKRAIIEEILRKLSFIIGEMSEEVGKEYLERVAKEMLKPVLTDMLQNPRMFSFRPILRYNRMPTRAMAIRTELPVDVIIKENGTSYMEDVRKQVSDKFSFVSEKLSLPHQHVPKAVTNMMGQSVKFVGQALPTSTYKQMEYMARDWQVEEHIETFLAYLIEKEEEKLQDALQYLEDIILHHMKSPITVWDPANGEIQMEQYLLFPVYSLDVMPVIDFVGYVEKVKVMMPKSLPSVDLPSLDTELMPPFTGVATVSNGKKITTFDGYVYDLDSDCTYVLTRDFMDENFTVILTNDEDRTLAVIVGKTVISINLQEQLLVNNAPVTLLPVSAGNMVVSKDTEDVIVISSKNHFTIYYNTNIDHITIKINGWYFGKTSGLLGIPDNEPSNDLMTSFNKPTDNINRFAKTWEVGTAKCR